VLATVTWAATAAIGMAIAGLVLVGVAIWVLVLAFRAGAGESTPQFPPAA